MRSKHLIYIIITALFFICGCSNTEKTSKVKNKKPVVITVKRKYLKEIKYTPIKGNVKVGPDGNLYIIVVDKKHGFINKQGQIVIPPQYDKVANFSDDVTTACFNYGKPDKYGSYKSKCGLIDKEGNLITRFKYDFDIDDLSEGLMRVCQKKKCGFIDNSGKEIIKLIFDYVLNFSEGLAAVKINNKWGFVDKYGKVVIKAKFNDAKSFSEGLAAIKIKSKWGFIDKSGQIVIEPQFDDIRSFSEGFSVVKSGDQWSYINKKGKPIITVSMDIEGTTHINAPESFKDGIAQVEALGFIDKTGKFIAKGYF